MIRHFFITVFRNILRNKLNSFINIFGLALGIATSFLILTHIRYELSYDRFYPKADRIYRITNEAHYGDQVRNWAPTAPLLAEEIDAYYPEIEKSTYIRQIQSVVLSYQPAEYPLRSFTERNGFFTDSAAIDIFDIEILKGNPATVLQNVHSIIITPRLAKKYFGKEDPIGKTILMENMLPLTVTGIFEEPPENTHLKIDFLITMTTFKQLLYKQGLEDLYNAKTWAGVYTYVLLNDKARKEQVEAKLPDFSVAYYQESEERRDSVWAMRKFSLQPITSIHLHSNLEQEISRNGNFLYILVFSITALFILFIAGVNFVNITTAQSFKRMKEVAVRKISGAPRSQMIRQFTGEAVLMTLISGVLGILFIDFMLPVYNNLSGKTLNMTQIFSAENILIMAGIVIALGILSGLYPSVFVSGFKPASSIRGIKDPGSTSSRLRKVLLVVQFILAGFMIFSTLVIYQQMRFFTTKDLGFDKHNLVAIRLNGGLTDLALKNPNTLKEKILASPLALEASILSTLPGERYSVEGLRPDSIPDDSDLPSIRFLRADEDYITTLGLELIDGKDYKDLPGMEHAYILNETAVRTLNLSNPVGRHGKSTFGMDGEIIGVVKDFHFSSLHENIEPMVIEYFRDEEGRRFGLGYVLVRLSDGRLPEGIDHLRKAVRELVPDAVFNHTVLESSLEALYKDEANVLNLFKAFSFLAIFIASLGLFGISAYTVELRTKEIGIRKTFGATLPEVVRLISIEFMAYVLIAMMVAIPAGWFFMKHWLQNFAYQIDIYWWIIALSLLITLMIAWLAISYQAIRAGGKHPADALRYE